MALADPRVLVVAQAFKGSWSAREVAGTLALACANVSRNIHTVIGSDGGDGLLDAVSASLTRRTQVIVEGPFGAATQAEVGWINDSIAMVESRLICGLSVAERTGKNPMSASTRGVGTAVLELERQGATSVVIGLGGSASVDGGTGFARAFAWNFRDQDGQSLPEGGGALGALRQVVEGRAPKAAIVGLADVRNGLTGPDGAIVYAPQKGANPAEVAELAQGLDRLVSVLAARDPRARERAAAVSAGAAGGLGFGLMHFAGGTLISGAAWVLERAGFDRLLAGADLVVTGEGAFDATSWAGKLTGEVMERARAAGVPVALVAPHAAGVPPDVIVESGGGAAPWTLADLARQGERAVRRALRLPLS